jgi:hypothetical protein
MRAVEGRKRSAGTLQIADLVAAVRLSVFNPKARLMGLAGNQ